MRAILIPVKAFVNAKSRLASALPVDGRAALVEAMCEDVFDAVTRVRGVDQVVVVSNEPRAIARAKELGWRAIAEQTQISESASVDMASRICEADGVTELLRLPADIPLVTPSDIEGLFASLESSRGCVISPSRDGTGTNALLRAPATAFASHFGSDSFNKHLAAAHAAEVHVTIISNPRVAVDVDDASDLEYLRPMLAPGSHTQRWFSETDRAPSGG